MDTAHVKELLTESVYERAVLSHILRNSENYYDMLSQLNSTDFLHPRHAVIFSTLGRMVESGVSTFDVPLLAHELDRVGDLHAVGGVDYLESLNNFQISNTNLELAIKKVHESSTKFKLYNALNLNQADVISGAYDSSELIGKLENSILDMSVKSRAISEPRSLAEGLGEYIEERRLNKVDMSGISTGYGILDVQIDGLVPGTLTIVAARKKAGKSAFLTNIALNVVIKQKLPVLYIDTEMSFKEWRDRALAAVSGVEERVIKHGGFKDKDYDDLMKNGYEKLKNSKIFHENMPGYSLDKITALYKKYKFKEDIGLAVFDYVKEPESSSVDRQRKEYQILGDVTTRLKDLANELEIPFLTAVQLNRANDIADSDRVARYGDVVAFWQQKSREELEEIKSSENFEVGTHRLIIKDTRRGGSTPEEGIYYKFNKTCLRIIEAKAEFQPIAYGNKVVNAGSDDIIDSGHYNDNDF